MNRCGGYSSSRSRGRGRQSWQRKTNDSSSDFQSPVQTDTTSTGRMSDSLDRKPLRTWQVKGHNSDGVVSQEYQNVAPVNCHSSSNVIGHKSDGIVSRNKVNVTSAGRHSQQHEHFVRGENNFRGGKAKKWIASSKTSSTIDSGDDKQPGFSSVEAKVPINLDRCVVESEEPDVSRLSLESKVETSHSDNRVVVLGSNEDEHDYKDNEHSGCSKSQAFDICPPKTDSVITLKPSLLATNREKRNELKKSIDEPKGIILRPGMVLLKSYLSSSEQANILRICRTQGLGSAGFYQPAYREGGELHLKMMCFGEFWDPETSKYWKVRPLDQAKPPSIPSEFLLLVDRAMKFSHSLIGEHSKVKNVEDILPPVYPDICLVNYYAKTGRLGLHQDKDESRESLSKGTPIVSFSIGDSAKFLYSDQRDAENADNVILESGDVLIFGGKSRHIFHGVSTILPDTAPKSLLESTNFRPGRLNLTFRQHL
ncbi:Alpha-ketoglutarate-dependent dioxygenase AlkB [Bienertia sinuspersici]